MPSSFIRNPNVVGASSEERPVMRKLSLSLLLLCGVSLAQTPPPQPPHLSLQEAVALALKNHPQVLAAQSEVEVGNQEVVEARSSYYPALTADVTGSQANHGARIGAGLLNDPSLFNRFGQGVILSQLITDSGRTKNLVAGSRLHAQAAAQDLQATRYDIVLGVNRSYYDVLHAQAVVKVAQETVAARQLLLDQVTALANNKLKSQLDVSFADVSVSEVKLLLIRAQASVEEAFAELARALGSDQPAQYQLADEPLPPSPPGKPDDLIAQAITNRPELASLRLSRESANRLYEAEKDLSRPTVSLAGVAGFLPYISPAGNTPTEYEAAAVNVSIPVFNGHLFSARREAARYHALEADQKLRDQQERVVRDVRVAWSGAMTAFQRIDVTAQYLRQASMAVQLAQGRYDLGLSSIIELTQAQLNQTQAEIENLSAKYDYESQFAVLQYAIGGLR
jgi:outer membrane protein